MHYAIIITTFNRPVETAKCLESLRHAQYLPNTTFIIVDDCSTDQTTLQLIREFSVPGYTVLHIRTEENSGIAKALYNGYNLAFDLLHCDIAMNLDNDALVNNMFQYDLVQLKAIWQQNIVSGFNCNTRNRDGSERHKAVGGGSGYVFRESVGGINMVLHKEQYEKYMRPALEHTISNKGNWDHLTCINSMKDNRKIISLKPSVMQHQATASSMGHIEEPDKAEDFKPLTLRDVTLVCVDDDLQRAVKAVEKSEDSIHFGAVVIISSGVSGNPTKLHNLTMYQIPRLGSKEAYSAFIINDLHKYIKTSHALIVQHDGYVKNATAWHHDWLQYDYIGAPWGPEYGNNRVGNGGFSLRSKKLLDLTSRLNLVVTHPEDAVICRELRPALEREHGIKFAHVEAAQQFSFEGYNQPGQWSGQFGFHGERAVVSAQPPRPVPAIAKHGIIFNQFLGLGDIFFLIQLARTYMDRGHDVVWPVADEYHADLKRHFPDIQFVPKSAFTMQYDNQREHWHRWKYGNYKVLPLRWNTIRTNDGSDAMTGKYAMVNEDFNIWRGLRWDRDLKKEAALHDVVGAHGAYELHAGTFGCAVTTGNAKVKKLGHTGLPVVELRQVPGYSLLDWTNIIMQANFIHAVSSSTLYMLERLPLKAIEVHLYGRDQGLKDFDYVRPLLTKEYIYHP